MPDRKPKQRPQTAGPQPPKVCAVCGRSIAWRKAWAKNWDEVKYCSDRCQAAARTAIAPASAGKALEAAILSMLQERAQGATICPSEAARAVAASEDRSDWEPMMEPARMAARRLVAQGLIEITQKGHVVDPSTAKGPIRLRLRGNGQ